MAWGGGGPNPPVAYSSAGPPPRTTAPSGTRMSDSPSQPPPVETADDFLTLARASGLVAEPRRAELEAALAPWRAAPGPMPAACHQRIVDGGLLTEWQIRKLLERAGRKKFFLDRFKLLRPLGQGGMGSVFLAEYRDPDLKRDVRVAIKLLPKKLQDKGQYLKRFTQESWVAASLNHPNIARAQFDFGDSEEDSPYHYSVMDYIEGVDLDRLVRKKGPLSAQYAAECVMQAALGLQHAHERGLVHRDIKPANLMVDNAGVVKILDFGLVQEDADRGDSRVLANLKALKDDERRKSLGTPDFMSPEQAEARAVDRRSDIYSLGCTLYFLLTGHAPFDHVTGEKGGKGTRIARMEAHTTLTAPDIRERRPHLPAKLVDLVQRMMARKPNDRPQTAQDVADEIFVILAGDHLETFDQQEAAAAAATGAAPRTCSAGPIAASTMASAAAPLVPVSGTSAGTSRSAGAGTGAATPGGRPPAQPSARQSDTPPRGSAARSTTRIPAAGQSGGTPPRPTGSAGGTTQRPAPSAPPPAAARSASAARAEESSAEPPPLLLRRFGGVPLAGWVLLGAALLAIVAVIAFRSAAG
jgi:hypothetical protein